MVSVMEMGQSTLAALRSVVTAVNVPVYLKVVVQADRHAVWYVDAIVAAPTAPEKWQPTVWDYSPATFIAGAVSSGALASALDPYDAQVLPLSGYNLTLPVLAPQVNWQHRPSRARFDSMVFPWPTHTFSPYLPNNPQRQPPQGYLIGDDCPSFPTYESPSGPFSTATTRGHRAAGCRRDSATYASCSVPPGRRRGDDRRVGHHRGER
jgi:hypothetical protein